VSRILIVLGAAAVIMVGAFRYAAWYADAAALPRYCGNPEQALARVQQIIAGQTDGFSTDRRGYIVASKLIFLVPQLSDEDGDAYRIRLRAVVRRACL